MLRDGQAGVVQEGDKENEIEIAPASRSSDGHQKYRLFKLHVAQKKTKKTCCSWLTLYFYNNFIFNVTFFIMMIHNIRLCIYLSKGETEIGVIVRLSNCYTYMFRE